MLFWLPNSFQARKLLTCLYLQRLELKMSNWFRHVTILVTLLFGFSSYSAEFREEDVVKFKSIERIESAKGLLKHREPGQAWTKIHFEFLILADSSLWVRPLLSANEEVVDFACFQLIEAFSAIGS